VKFAEAARALGLARFEDVSARLKEGADLIWEGEELHSRQLHELASKVLANQRLKAVLVAGPSGSNKTTMAYRLAQTLAGYGIVGRTLSTDDYFCDRIDVPLGEDGTPDFESPCCVLMDLVAERTNKLLAHEPIPARKFDMKTGVGGDDRDKELVIPEGVRGVAIIEGLHALNEAIVKGIGADAVLKVAIFPSFSLGIAGVHPFTPSDIRLLRRMARDCLQRDCPPFATLERWTSVRVGEERFINQALLSAEYYFNSALLYELPVLATAVRPFLVASLAGRPAWNDPKQWDQEVVAQMKGEAQRVLNCLQYLEPVPQAVMTAVPANSMLREFIGGSFFTY
jgi:uridine kinase